MYLLSWRPGRTSCARSREQCTCACFSRRPGHWSSPLLFLPSVSRSLVLGFGYSEVPLELKGPQQTLIRNDKRRMFKRSSEQSTMGKNIWNDSFQEYFFVIWQCGTMPCKQELKQCIFFTVQTLTTKDCKGPQSNMPENVGSIKTWSAKMKSRHIKFCKQNTAMLTRGKKTRGMAWFCGCWGF